MIQFPVCRTVFTAIAPFQISFMILCLPLQAMAQERIDLSGHSARIVKELPSLDFTTGPAVRDTKARDRSQENDPVLRAFSRALGLKPDRGESIAFLYSNKVPLTDMTTWHMEQRYQNIPVWGERITVTTMKGRKPQRISGHTLHNLSDSNLSVMPGISAQKALQIGQTLSGLKQDGQGQDKSLSGLGQQNALPFQSGTNRPGTGRPDIDGMAIKESHPDQQGLAKKSLAPKKGTLKNLVRQVIYFSQETGKSHLAWEVSFFAVIRDRPTKPLYIINAQNGKVLLHYDNLQQLQGSGPGGNMKTGCYTYGQGKVPALQIRKNKEGMCLLQSKDVTTWDCGHQKDYKNCKVHSFPCNTNSSRKINGACAPLNDAHFFSQLVFDMYRDWYSMSPLKKHLNVLAHYGKNLDNAFWNGRYIHFGDGHKTFYPTAALDIASHEIGHGFTQQHSGLIYKAQSGGLNEAFSDMAGEAAEAYFHEKYQKQERPDDIGIGLAGLPRSPRFSVRPDQIPRNRPVQGIARTTANPEETSQINSMISGQPDPLSSPFSGNPEEKGINALLDGGKHKVSTPRATAPNHGLSGQALPEAPAWKRQEKRARAGHSEKTMFGHKLPDWTVGSDIFKKDGGALRYMANPPRDGKSIDSAIKYYNGMDVHHSSGIFNKAFYLLANKPGWSVRKAFAVFLVASHSWTPRENFLSAALKTLQAAKDLKYETQDVKSVFRAVHVFVDP